MDSFIKKLVIFTILFGVYCLSMYAINSMIIEAKKPVVTGKNTVIIGDSHPKFALNPNLLSSAVNVAQTSEPYYISYWKLKELIAENEIDTVMLGFSYNNLSAVNDIKLKDPFWAHKMFTRIYPIEEFHLLKDVEIDLWNFYRTKFENMCLYPNPNHINYLGSYNNIDQSDITEYELVISRHFFYEDEQAGVSKTTIAYLDSIYHLCRKNEIELVLISTPMHPKYLEHIPDNIVRAFKEVKAKMEDSEGALVLDYGHREYNNEFFLNVDHLNQKGADYFTREVKMQLGQMSKERMAVDYRVRSM